MNTKLNNISRGFGAILIVCFGVLTLTLNSAAATAPVIASFSPTNGPVDARITITGDNLITATNVEFNGTSAGFSIFGNELIATVPTNATTGSIHVFTPGGVAVSANFFTVTVLAPPLITSFSPAHGPVGTSVIIVGENLSGVTAVLFDGTAALFSAGFTGTNLTAAVPTNATGGFITVITSAGTNSTTTAFTVTATPAPVITDFTPVSGSVGTRVIITGTNFSGATAVRFNGVEAKFNPGFFGNTLTAFVPAGAAAGPVSVVTPGGTNASTKLFTVVAALAPAIRNFDPVAGQARAKITITGANLAGVTDVKFNGTSATFTTFAGAVVATVPTNCSAVIMSDGGAPARIIL